VPFLFVVRKADSRPSMLIHNYTKLVRVSGLMLLEVKLERTPVSGRALLEMKMERTRTPVSGPALFAFVK